MRRATVAFIFALVVMDVVALGIVIPVLPKLVEGFMGGDTARASGIYGAMTTAWGVMQFLAMPVVGMIYSGSSDGSAVILSAFREGLSEAGFVDGRNVVVELRFAENHLDRLAAQAAELAQRPVAVIVGNTLGAKAAKAATSTIPIVVALSNDLVADGLVTSYNRPGGNVTGIAFLSAGLGAKRLGLLRQVVPGATTIGVLA